MIRITFTYLFFLAIVSSSVGIAYAAEKRLDSSAWQNLSTLKLESDDFGNLLRKAAEACNRSLFDDCIQFSKKASKVKPDDFRPYMILGIAFRAQRKLTSASKSFAAAISRNPKNVKLYMEKGWTDYLRNAREEALVSYRTALKLNSKQGRAYLQIGIILSSIETTHDQAIEAYESAIALQNPVLEAYDELGSLYNHRKNYSKAEAVFRKGMAADSQKMVGRLNLGRMLIKLGRVAEARKLWEGRTSDEDRTIPPFITTLKRAEKVDVAKQALLKNPNSSQKNFDMGMAVRDGESWRYDGRHMRAIGYFEKALELNPNFVEAQYAMVVAYIQVGSGRTKPALKYTKALEKLRQMSPELAKKAENYKATFRGALTASPASVENN